MDPKSRTSGSPPPPGIEPVATSKHKLTQLGYVPIPSVVRPKNLVEPPLARPSAAPGYSDKGDGQPGQPPSYPPPAPESAYVLAPVTYPPSVVASVPGNGLPPAYVSSPFGSPPGYGPPPGYGQPTQPAAQSGYPPPLSTAPGYGQSGHPSAGPPGYGQSPGYGQPTQPAAQSGYPPTAGSGQGYGAPPGYMSAPIGYPPASAGPGNDRAGQAPNPAARGHGFPPSPVPPTQSWKWTYSGWIGIMYGPIPVGIILGIVVLIAIYASK